MQKPQYFNGLVTINSNKEWKLEMTLQECWELQQNLELLINRDDIGINLKPIRIINKNNLSFKIRVTKNTNFWTSLQANTWELNTFKVFDAHLSSNHVFIDLGAWIGSTSLYGAQLAKRTYAFEPDPVAFKELEENVRINLSDGWAQRCNIFNEAISLKTGIIKLGSLTNGGDSASSSFFTDTKTQWEVNAVTFKEFILRENISKEELFIKIDIEGSEYDLLPTLKPIFITCKTVLLLSIHPQLLAKHLMQTKKGIFRNKLFRRLSFVNYQVRLLHSLRFKYLYHSDGTRFNYFREIFHAILLGTFSEEILATNKQWENQN